MLSTSVRVVLSALLVTMVTCMVVYEGPSGYSGNTENNLYYEHGAEVRVFVIYTGGTIGMTNTGGGLKPEPNALVKFLRKLPIFHDEGYAERTRLYARYPRENVLVLPLNQYNKRIVYSIKEYEPLLDSSNMTPSDWEKIAKDIENNYDRYKGFVILHGTDTMAYTASALSFMCENLGKPVILTGAQLPIYQLRNDGRDNLLGALLIAGQFDIPEVGLYFYNKLYRGNRVTKVDAMGFSAFDSPNLEPLATANVDITVDWDIVLKANSTAKFSVSTELNHKVGVLRLFPGITAATVRAFLQSPMEGVVLQTFGAGNPPDSNKALMNALKEATARGVVIINVSQCLRGTVSAAYATGQALEEVGVINGHDMTQEAAMSKLAYVLAKSQLDPQDKKKMMEGNLRGELSLGMQEEQNHVATTTTVATVQNGDDRGRGEDRSRGDGRVRGRDRDRPIEQYRYHFDQY